MGLCPAIAVPFEPGFELIHLLDFSCKLVEFLLEEQRTMPQGTYMALLIHIQYLTNTFQMVLNV